MFVGQQGRKGKTMPREFDNYYDAKQYCDAMVADRKRCGQLHLEIRNLENVLNNKHAPLTEQRKEEINEEIRVYTRVKNNIEHTFQEKYQLKDTKELADEIRAFKQELELLGRHVKSQDEHTTQQGGQSGQGQTEQQRTLTPGKEQGISYVQESKQESSKLQEPIAESIQKSDYDRAYDDPPHHVRPDSPGRVRETDYDK